MDELHLDRTFARGSNGRRVRIIQEWLCLHGYHIAIDGKFGPATEAAVIDFQLSVGLPADGKVTLQVYDALVQPIRDAIAPIASNGKSLAAMIVLYSQQHLASHPREIGGQNRGPWVRLYMNGKDGDGQLWCAGFVSYLISAACRDCNKPLPFRLSPSCDELVKSAKQADRFISETSFRANHDLVSSGSLFVVRASPTNWTHVGVVAKIEPDVMRTIEGNTNDDGDREGYEVCARIRNYSGKDFIEVV